MGEPLRLAPLVEALCEFRFASFDNAEWDLTLPGRLYELIGKEFSVSFPVSEVRFQIQHPVGTVSPSQVIIGPQRVQLRRADESAMVQLGPNLLVINHLQPYQSWEVFCSLIIRIFSQYTELCKQSVLDRIGLRYVNQIPVPSEEGFELSNFLTVVPNLKDSLERPLTGFQQRYEIDYDKPLATLIHQTAIIERMDRGVGILLDLDFNSQKVGSFANILEIKEWLNLAHDHINAAFRSSLNTEFYNSLK